MKNNRLLSSILSLSMLCAMPLTSYALPDGSQPLGANGPNVDELEKYSDIFARAKKMMDDPKTWNKIPPKVTLCVFSPEGAKGKGYDFAMSYLKQLPKYTQIAKTWAWILKSRWHRLWICISTWPHQLPSVKASTDVKFRVYTNEKSLQKILKRVNAMALRWVTCAPKSLMASSAA